MRTKTDIKRTSAVNDIVSVRNGDMTVVVKLTDMDVKHISLSYLPRNFGNSNVQTIGMAYERNMVSVVVAAGNAVCELLDMGIVISDEDADELLMLADRISSYAPWISGAATTRQMLEEHTMTDDMLYDGVRASAPTPPDNWRLGERPGDMVHAANGAGRCPPNWECEGTDEAMPVPPEHVGCDAADC